MTHGNGSDLKFVTFGDFRVLVQEINYVMGIREGLEVCVPIMNITS